MKLSQKLVVPFIFLLVIFSNTCKSNVGLGGHIDITPPTCQLTFPTESLPTIRNSFTLKGVASDDNIVDKVKVVLKSVDRAWEGALELPCTVEKSGDSWQWSVVVNKPNADGSFPLKDGKYNVKILAYDKDGKEGVSTSVLIIDNTPPVLFLRRPSSFATINKTQDVSDNYGADLIIKGTAADDSELSSLEFFAYGDNWESTTIKNISTSINLKIDGFFSSTATEKGIYRKLYGDDANAGLKTFPCAIKIYDNAKEYDSPNSTGDKEKGNVSNDYYLYDVLYNIEDQKDVNKQLIFPKYNVQDVYDMLKGSFYLNDKGVEDAEKKAEANKIIEALKTGRFGESKKRFMISCPSDMQGVLTDENRALMGLLGLNPFKNPTYEVLGIEPRKIDFNETSFNGVYSEYERAKGGNVTIKISPNLDESPLKEAEKFEFYYCEISAFVKYFRDNHRILTPSEEGFKTKEGVKEIEGVDIKKVGSSYMATVPVKGDINVGSSYVILVKGYDKEDNLVMLDPKNIKSNGSNITYAYGIKVVGSGAPSDVKVTRIENLTTSYHYGDGVHELSERAFVKYGDDVKFKFVASSESVPIKVSYKLKFGAVEKANDQKLSVPVDVPDEFTIHKSKFEKGQIHTLIVEVTDVNAQTTSRTYQIWCDDKAPEVDIKPFDEFLSAFPKINGRLYDVGSGVDVSDLKVEYTYNNEAKKTINAVGENGEWKLADITPTPKEGVYKFYFKVKDKVGNEPSSEKLVTIRYDKAAPAFEEINGEQGQSLREGKRIDIKTFTNIASIPLSGKIKESNGVASLKIGFDGIFNDSNPSTYQEVATTPVTGQDDAYSFSTSFDLKYEKERVLVFKVVDGVGRENILKVKILADKTAPEFKKMKLGVKEFEKASATNNFTTDGSVTIGSTVVALTANVFDDGSGVEKLEVYKEATPTNVLFKTLIPVPSGNGLYTIDSPLELGLGRTVLVFTLYDKFGKTISWKCDVSVENASLNLELKAKTPNPTFSLSKDASTIEARGEFELSAKGTNTTSSSSLDLEVTVEKDNAPVPSAKLLSLLPSPLPAGVSIDNGKIQGLKSGTSSTPATEYKFIFKPNNTGIDDGRYVFNLNSSTVTKKFVVIVDNKAPSITPIYPTLGANVFDATADIKITCYDEASGIKKVECEYKSGEIVPMALVNGAYICKIPTADVQEGTYTLKFKAEDKLGNLLDISLPTLYYDKADPTIELQGSVPEKLGPNYSSTTLLAKLKDSNGLKSFVTSLVKKNGNIESWKEEKNVSGKDIDENITLDSAKFIKGDGIYLLRIECKDVAEKSSKIIEKEIWYDATKPTLNVTTPSTEWINTKTYKVEGTANDGADGVGVKVVKYKVNNGLEQVLSGKDNWDGYLELNEGENNLVFFAEDEVKNKSIEVMRTIKVDTKAPSLGFVTPLTGEKLLAHSSPLGEVELSANDLPSGSEPVSGIKEARYSENPNSTFDDATPMTKTGTNYKVNITSMPPASVYYFWVKDKAGNVSEVLKLKVEVDRFSPEISLEQVIPSVEISSKKYTNKIAVVTGTVSDDRGIKDIKIKDSNDLELQGFVKKDWEIQGNKRATFSFSFDTSQYTNGTTLKIKAIAEDIAGNTKTSALFDVHIKQETDIPVVTVSSFEKISKASLINSKRLTGDVKDDDGIRAVEIKVNNENFVPVTKQAKGTDFWTWVYTLPDGIQEGKVKLEFKVIDSAGSTFIVGNANVLERVRVKGTDDGDNDFKDADIEFDYDNTHPEISSKGVHFSLTPVFPPPSGAITKYSDVGELVGTNTVLGNADKKNISFRMLAYDASGIKSALLTIGGVSISLPHGSTQLSTVKEDGFDVIDFNNLNISTIPEGSVPLKIEVTDNSGFVSTWQSTCIIDFKSPVVELTSPIDTVYFGDVSIMGKITDEPTNPGSSVSGVDESSITFKIGNSSFVKEHKDGGVLLSSIENTSASWTIKIPNIKEYAKKDASDASKYGAVKPTGSSQIWSIPIKIKGKDKAGNEVMSVAYDVKFDPNGDTPYIDILSPGNGAVLGGTVMLSGTARVADQASGKTVDKVYLQLSKTPSFDGTPWNIGARDYGQANGEQIASDISILYWSHPLSADDLLSDLPIGVSSRKIYFRLRGQSGTTVGEWTNPREFTISTDVAKFSDVKLVNGSYNAPYAANAKWLRGDGYEIKGKVTHSDGIRSIDAKTGLVGSGIQALDQSNKSGWFTQISNGYDFSIPVKTNQYSQKYGYIEFDIEATDSRSDNAKTVYQKVLLKYDNSIPSCAIGTPVVVDNAGFSGGKFTSSQELQQNDKAYYRVLVDGRSYKVRTIAVGDGKEIELENATGLSGSFDYSIVKEPKIIEGDNFQVEGVAEDSGSGVQTIKVTLEVGSTTQEVTVTSSDYSKFKRRRGNIVSFNVGINTKLVSNGEGKLTIKVIDEAGNEITQSVENVLVKNLPVIIKNIIFATDLSGNNGYEGDEIYNCVEKNPKVVAENNWKLNSENDFRGKIDVSSVFTYKNKSHSYLKIECKDGYGNITASLYRIKDEERANFDTKDIDKIALDSLVATVTNSNSGNDRTLMLDFNNALSETDDGKGEFILKITDGSGSLWYAGMKIRTKVEIGDSVIPKGAIFPFFYNSEKDKLESAEEQKLSSVKYEGDEPQGHIEIGKFESNEVSSVSGKVILRGFSYDNAKITAIRLTLPKDSKSGGARVKSTETKTSTYNGTAWSGELKINKSNFTNTGHYVEWEYEWDSNNTLCANDVEIKLEVRDAKNLLNGTTLTRPIIKQGVRALDNDRAIELASGDVANKYDVVALTDKDEKVYFVSVSEMKENQALWANVNVPSDIGNYALYNGNVNVPSMKINVVPYISKVTTSLSSYSSATPSLYDRTALGHYPCRDDEKIKIEGFNFNHAKFYLEQTDLGSSTTLNMILAQTSGSLEARVEYNDGGSKVIRSLNNTDDNKKAYNKCSNKINNDLLNNDVLIDVWGFKVGANPTDGFVSYPVLKISPKDGKVGLAFANGVAHFNMAGYDSSNSNWRSSRQFDRNWAQYVFTDFVFDDYGYSYGMATGVDMNKGQGVASYSKFLARRAGVMADRNNYGASGGGKTGFGQRLENIGTQNNPYTADPDRIQSPSIAAVAAEDFSKTTRIYLAYYDAINKHIRYRYGSVSGNTGEANCAGQLVDLFGYGLMQEPDKDYYSILAGPKTKLDPAYPDDLQGSTGTNTAGKYVSIGAIKNGNGSKDVVVALWYNFQARSLMYAYCDDPRKDNVTWKGLKTVDVGGEYVKCAVDDSNGIHVAYYSKGDLKYAYLPSYNATNWKLATVDSYSLTGTNLSIDLAKDPSTMKWVPYIGYYMAGNANARLAYLVGGVDSDVPDGAGKDEKYTGKWEISIIPTQSAIREYRISVGVFRNPNAGPNKGVITAIPTASIPAGQWITWKGVQPYGREGESIVGGNGTANPILGYAVEEGGAFELAQKK